MKRIILSTVMGLLGILAMANVASACWFGMHQPELPKALQK
jgi:cyclic lactone autoinducer peptide